MTAQARAESLRDCIRDAAERLNSARPLRFSDHLSTNVTDQSEAVLCLTDWHYGMMCDNVFNEFNTEICRRRVSQLVDSVIERVQLHNIGTMHVLLLGDFAHGAIHPTVRIESTEQTCDQLMQVSEMLA